MRGVGLERYRKGPKEQSRPVRKAWFPVQNVTVDVSMEEEARQRSLGSSMVMRAVGSHGRCLSKGE